MTNNKDLKTIQQQFKEQLNTPKTETRLVLEQEDLDPDLVVKKSKLSLAARNKVVNRSGSDYVSENQVSYGPCPEGESTSEGTAKQEAARIKITIEYDDDDGGLRCIIL